jgi:hypothetical protein
MKAILTVYNMFDNINAMQNSTDVTLQSVCQYNPRGGETSKEALLVQDDNDILDRFPCISRIERR